MNGLAARLAARPGYRWWVIAMLWGVCFFNYADRQAISAVFPALREEFGFTNTEIGAIGSAFGYVYGIGALFAGYVADRVARRHLILGGCLFWSAVTVATAWCQKTWHFVSVRALEGLGETFYFPASMSLASDYHGPATRSRAFSLHQSGVYVGTIAGSWLGGWFAEHLGWRAGFYVFGFGGMILATVLYACLHEPRRGGDAAAAVVAPTGPAPAAPGFRTAVLDVLRVPTAWCLLAVFVGANFVATVFLTWTPTFLAEKFGFRLAAAGLSGALFIHLASALAVAPAGCVADWWARRRPGGRLYAQAAGLLAGAGWLVGIGSITNVGWLLTAMAAFGVCKGFYDAGIFASLYDVVPARSRATAAGLMNTVGWGLGSLGALLAGWYADHGPLGSPMANMSRFITGTSALYLGGGLLLAAAAAVLVPRDRAARSE